MAPSGIASTLLVLFQNDLGIGGHLRFQDVLFVRDRNPHFEGRDVVFLRAHRRNLRHVPVELLIFERFHRDARRLAEIHFADIAFVRLCP